MAEVELKFGIAARDVDRLRGARALAGVKARERRMLALYLDTPDALLAAHRMALRLRREGSRWVQALKAGGAITGGLHARDEWEFPSPDATLDLARFRDTPLATLPGSKTLHERLTVLFQVDMQRTTWLVRPARGVRLEVALDVGDVCRGAARDDVREVEIESQAGPHDAVFDFAERLLDDVPLVPSAVSKAQRGYRLVRGTALTPVHAKPVALSASMGTSAATAAVLAASLAQIVANAEGVARHGDPEFVHQLRVGLRRLRSGLRLFRKSLGAGRTRALHEPWRAVMAVTGRARDLDVLALETLPALEGAIGRATGTTALHKRLDAARREARTQLVDTLAAPAFARAVLSLGRSVHALAAIQGDGDLPRDCARFLRKTERRFRRAGAGFHALDADSRHRLRIRAKRLRYGLDACASLFAPERVEPYAAALSRLQDALGDANDARVARSLLETLEPSSAFATRGFAWLEARELAATRAAAPWLAALAELDAPWRKP